MKASNSQDITKPKNPTKNFKSRIEYPCYAMKIIIKIHMVKKTLLLRKIVLS